MNVLLAIVTGGLFGAGVFMLLRRNPFRLIVGLALLANAINLLIFTAAGLTRARPPLIPTGAEIPPENMADPLPQALILTAIVISFGLLAFTIVLFSRTFETLKVNDFAEMKERDE